MKEIKKVMYGNSYVWKIMCVLYAMAFVLNIITGIKNKNIADIENCFWILNTINMFACARMNEKRADKFEKIYLDGIEKDIKQKVDKYLKEQKNESI